MVNVAPNVPDASNGPTGKAQGRAKFDAYWTPDAHALACVRWLADRLCLTGRERVLEPAVGGGSWARAARAVMPDCKLYGIDIDSTAPGLGDVDALRVGDFFTYEPEADTEFDLILGNPPYKLPALLRWIERSLELAPVVAYLLRETVTGTSKRLPWWLAHRPAYTPKVVPRPKWEGPGARPTADFSDSILVVWVRGPIHDTLSGWIDVNALGNGCLDG